jgi:hypothetical protein
MSALVNRFLCVECATALLLRLPLPGVHLTKLARRFGQRL